MTEGAEAEAVTGDVNDPVLVPGDPVFERGDTNDPVLDGKVGVVVRGTDVVGIF